MMNVIRTVALLSFSLLTACSGSDSVTGVSEASIAPPVSQIPASQLRPTSTLTNYASTPTIDVSSSSVFAPSVSDTIRTTFVFSTTDDSVRAIMKAAVPVEMSFALSTFEILRSNGSVERISCPLDLTRTTTGILTASAVRCHPLNVPTAVTLRRGDVATLRIAGVQTSSTKQARTMVAAFEKAEITMAMPGWRLIP